jgi:hypothetical protein
MSNKTIKWPTATWRPPLHSSGHTTFVPHAKPYNTKQLDCFHVRVNIITTLSDFSLWEIWQTRWDMSQLCLFRVAGRHSIRRLEFRHSQHWSAKGNRVCHLVCSAHRVESTTKHRYSRSDIGLCVVHCFHKYQDVAKLKKVTYINSNFICKYSEAIVWSKRPWTGSSS